MQDEQTSTRESTRGRADIHMHSTYSDGLATPEQIVRFAERSALNVIAITDPDTLEGALIARELVAKGRFAFEVIVGTEVTTARGVHLLALFIEEPIPLYRSLEYTIDVVAKQGGICIAPHPLSPLTPSVGRGQIERLLAARYPLMGVETMNPTPAGRITRAKLLRLNMRWRLAAVGGSDAHFLCRIGTAYTEFAGRTATDFRACLSAGTTTACEVPLPHPHVRMSDYVRQSGKSMLLNPAQKVQRRMRRGA
jgi:hypothetical protein